MCATMLIDDQPAVSHFQRHNSPLRVGDSINRIDNEYQEKEIGSPIYLSFKINLQLIKTRTLYFKFNNLILINLSTTY